MCLGCQHNPCYWYIHQSCPDNPRSCHSTVQRPTFKKKRVVYFFHLYQAQDPSHQVVFSWMDDKMFQITGGRTHQSSLSALLFKPPPLSSRPLQSNFSVFLPSSYWSSSYLWSVSSSLAVIFWKKPICWRRWCCICERKSRTRVRWKCWISASVAQEMMLQRSWSSPSCFGQSFTLVSAPEKRWGRWGEDWEPTNRFRFK